MAKKLASLEIRFQEESIKLFPLDGITNLKLDAGKSDLLHRLISTLSCYREHRNMLVDTQYSKLVNSLPDYYHERKLLIVLCCTDGVIVRHDLHSRSLRFDDARLLDVRGRGVRGLTFYEDDVYGLSEGALWRFPSGALATSSGPIPDEHFADLPPRSEGVAITYFTVGDRG